MDMATAVSLGIWGAFAISVVLRLRRAGAAAFDDRFTPGDRRLVGAAAFYLAVPASVLLSQLAQVAALRLAGAELGHVDSYLYWGVVEPARGHGLSHLGRAGIAAVGPLTLVAIAALAIAWTWRRPSSAARNGLRIELSRVLLLLAFGLHPLTSLALGRGDFHVMREALDARHPESGGLALLGYGILAAYAFFRWRRADALRLLATPIHDAARRAHARLADRPDDAEALRALGAAQLAASDPRAVDTLARAHAIRPDDARTELALGRAHLEQGDAGAASEHLRHAGQLLEDEDDEGLLFEVTLALSAARMALGDAEGAVLTAEAARDRAPWDVRGLLMIADSLVAVGRRDEARVRLEAGLGAADGRARHEIRRRLAALRPR